MTTLADDSIVYELLAHMRLLPNPRCQCLNCRAAAEIGRLQLRVTAVEDMLHDQGKAGKEIKRLEVLAEFQQRYIRELSDRLNALEVTG